ncbi:hypothetical protein N658DRAFT_491861 [Parathielavia hyrcaniae]|uniref:Uncharacterized protein n=1 Tax=Parathielavia hyrcaniae TaxID=113614 RepID=A0AAN6T5D8_9PEZI|nr:hypothetical protein N658DRAFT_491861 [Parathielavia hyrcaniae]
MGLGGLSLGMIGESRDSSDWRQPQIWTEFQSAQSITGLQTETKTGEQRDKSSPAALVSRRQTGSHFDDLETGSKRTEQRARTQPSLLRLCSDLVTSYKIFRTPSRSFLSCDSCEGGERGSADDTPFRLQCLNVEDMDGVTGVGQGRRAVEPPPAANVSGRCRIDMSHLQSRPPGV